eukprot:gene1562-biopygen12473
MELSIRNNDSNSNYNYGNDDNNDTDDDSNDNGSNDNSNDCRNPVPQFVGRLQARGALPETLAGSTHKRACAQASLARHVAAANHCQ